MKFHFFVDFRFWFHYYFKKGVNMKDNKDLKQVTGDVVNNESLRKAYEDIQKEKDKADAQLRENIKNAKNENNQTSVLTSQIFIEEQNDGDITKNESLRKIYQEMQEERDLVDEELRRKLNIPKDDSNLVDDE
jgi:hypothetical protein